MFAIAGYVSASRLTDNRHFLGDVLFGSALGIATDGRRRRHGRDTFSLGRAVEAWGDGRRLVVSKPPPDGELIADRQSGVRDQITSLRPRSRVTWSEDGESRPFPSVTILPVCHPADLGRHRDRPVAVTLGCRLISITVNG